MLIGGTCRGLSVSFIGEWTARTDPIAAEDTRASFARALALADHLSVLPLVAHCHFGLGQVYRRADRVDQANEHLMTAMQMFRDKGMAFCAEKALAEMRERR